jgi:N-acetylmuramoyl-L-alanine amidase
MRVKSTFHNTSWLMASSGMLFLVFGLAPRFAHAAESSVAAPASTPSAASQKGLRNTGRKFLVVIDPGHGGPDTGAVYKDKGNTYTEKMMTLLIGRDLARELIIKGHSVILTRNDDRLINLSDRTALANRLKADIFISIHLNSSAEKMKSGGVETFILNHATDASSKRLADLENSVLKESSANANSGSANVSLIMKDLILDGSLEPSRQLACNVQARLKTIAVDRGVKQALFYVLLGADMPSILIEGGFLNAKADRERILDTQSRMKMAAEMANAIDDYRSHKSVKGCHVGTEKQFQRVEDPKRHSRL